ncbi:MAG: hypothetical protein ACR2IH_05200 [Pyrinomonadaceae bacterium]
MKRDAKENENGSLRRWQLTFLVVGVVALAACTVGFAVEPLQFFRSYLLAFIFWICLVVGALGILMMGFVTGGRWQLILRRPLFAATKTLPLLFGFFLPVLLGLRWIYSWTDPAVVAIDETLQKKQGYLNEPFFIARAVAYFVIWTAVTYFLARWSKKKGTADDPAKFDWRLEHLSGWGMFVVGITFSLALVDWVMSLEPDWYSTIYAVSFISGSMLSAYAFSIGFTALFVLRDPVADLITREQMRGLGNLLLAFVMLWAYCSYSQFLLIWSGNLREEITWYIPRIQTEWGWIAIALILFHFFLPFFLLLSRDLKQKRKALFAVALVVFVMRFVDVFWLVKPAFSPQSLWISWLDLAATIGLGGVWLACFLWIYEREPLPVFEILQDERKGND